MKKHLLKALLICLGATLICGMSSFRIPERVKSQQCNRIASVVNDTVITSEGEVSRVIKEVVVENGQRDCSCKLYVWGDGVNGGLSWQLLLENSCSKFVDVTYSYKLYYRDGSTKIISGSATVGHQTSITSGQYSDKICEPIDLVVICPN